jgi:hypothetical protein
MHQAQLTYCIALVMHLCRPGPNYNLIPFLRLNKAIATIGFTVKRGTWESSRVYQPNRQFLETLFNA